MRMVKKVVLYCIGMFLMALGVSFSVKSNLGVSPVNSIPYVLSTVTGIEQGTLTIVVFSLFVVLQIIILRRDFKWINLLQVVFSSIFGVFVTVSNAIVAFPAPTSYPMQIVLLVISLIVIAFGILCYLTADIVPLPSEGVMLAISQKTGIKFHVMKITFDMTVVVIACIISFIGFHELRGIREGTFIAAFGVGKIIGWITKPVKPKLKRFLGEDPDEESEQEREMEELEEG